MSTANPDVPLSEEELERKKKKEEKAKEKELKKQKAAQKAAEAAKLKKAAEASKKKPGWADAGVENPEDFIDPETPSGDKKKLSKQMAKQFSPEAVEKSCMHGGRTQVSLRRTPTALNLLSQPFFHLLM